MSFGGRFRKAPQKRDVLGNALKWNLKTRDISDDIEMEFEDPVTF